MGDSFRKPSGIGYVSSNPTVGKYRYITSVAENDSGAQTCMVDKTQALGGIEYMSFNLTAGIKSRFHRRLEMTPEWRLAQRL